MDAHAKPCRLEFDLENYQLVKLKISPSLNGLRNLSSKYL